MKKLKILNVVDTYFPVVGGVQSVVHQSSCALSKYADVTVATVKAKNYTDSKQPYKILRCKGFYNKITGDGLAFINLDRRFRNEVETGGYDIIHCHTCGPLYNYCLKVGKKLGIPVVSTTHSYYKPDIKNIVKTNWLANLITSSFVKKTNKSDHVFTVTEFCKRQLLPFGLTKDSTVLNNAIEFIPPQNLTPLNEKINKLHNINNNVFVLTFVSRMVKIKNIDLIVDAISLLKDKNLNLKVFLIGGGSYFDSIKKKIKDLDLENYFIMTGMIRDRNLVSSYYSRANLVLFPSFIESAGLIQMEAAAFKKPTIVIENSAPSEKIIHLENGIISKNDPQDFADKILYCYNNKKDLEQIGINAHKTIYRVYSDKSVTDEILEMYKNCIKEFNKKKMSKRK